MKKLAPLFVFAALALTSIAHAQTPTPAAGGDEDAPFGGPLSAHRPKPKAAATTTTTQDNGGKRMVGEATIASDEKGAKTTASFPAGTTTVYLVTKNVSGAKGDKVLAEWFADDAGKALPKGKRFYNSAISLPNTASYNPNFHVTGPIKGTFPPGKYHVDVSVGGEKLKSAKFAVQ